MKIIDRRFTNHHLEVIFFQVDNLIPKVPTETQYPNSHSTYHNSS